MKIIVLVGPTASGKTDVSIEVAGRLNGEIVNADSRQFYRELDKGTAKPPSAMLEKAAHHLVDCASITSPWTVADYVREADQAIRQIVSRGKIPIIVGGTGLYVRGLLFGIDSIPQIDQKIRDKLQSEFESIGLPGLYSELKRVDADYAAVLPPQDKQRILRALEVYRQTGKRIRDFWVRRKTPRYDYVKLGIDVSRERLYERINMRVDDMINQGLQDEVLGLYKKFPRNPVLEKTIGYAEWIRHAFGDKKMIIDEIKINSRHFAKRQMTWFRHETDIAWARADEVLKILREKI